MVDELDLMGDALNEIQEEMHRLMEMHLEVMTYFTRALEREREGSKLDDSGHKLSHLMPVGK